tara:strand:+ start:1800 stop:2618 length:819 start_codon:yes stop_codon:yes gene_type:complete
MRRRAKKIQRSSARGVATRRRGGVNRNRRGARSGGHTHQAGHQHSTGDMGHSSHAHGLYNHLASQHGMSYSEYTSLPNYMTSTAGNEPFSHTSGYTGQAGNMQPYGTGSMWQEGLNVGPGRHQHRPGAQPLSGTGGGMKTYNSPRRNRSIRTGGRRTATTHMGNRSRMRNNRNNAGGGFRKRTRSGAAAPCPPGSPPGTIDVVTGLPCDYHMSEEIGSLPGGNTSTSRFGDRNRMRNNRNSATGGYRKRNVATKQQLNSRRVRHTMFGTKIS